LSVEPEISKLDGNLYKLGFTAGKVETRIQAARHQPTYLLAPVRPVKTYTLYNVDPAKLENLLHRFFADARLDIELMDRFGKPYRPQEWFLVRLEMIDQAVAKLIDGSITGVKYDARTCTIVPLK
jgi:Meiotically up-regulated gene 113